MAAMEGVEQRFFSFTDQKADIVMRAWSLPLAMEDLGPPKYAVFVIPSGRCALPGGLAPMGDSVLMTVMESSSGMPGRMASELIASSKRSTPTQFAIPEGQTPRIGEWWGDHALHLRLASMSDYVEVAPSYREAFLVYINHAATCGRFR